MDFWGTEVNIWIAALAFIMIKLAIGFFAWWLHNMKVPGSWCKPERKSWEGPEY